MKLWTSVLQVKIKHCVTGIFYWGVGLIALLTVIYCMSHLFLQDR